MIMKKKTVYISGCAEKENGGGIYECELTAEGKIVEKKRFPCDRPMFAVIYDGRLHVLLLKKDELSVGSGYFSCRTDFSHIGRTKDTLGVCACHIAAGEPGIFIANYLSGNISKNCAVVAAHSGRGVNLPRQDAPHTHFAAFTPDGKYLICTDLGLDTLYVYDFDLNEISAAKVPDGAGIRHAVFSADGKKIYAVNELKPSVSVFDYADGVVRLMGTVILPCKNRDATAAAIRLTDKGQLYVSVRGEDVIFVLDAERPVPEIISVNSCGGKGPRDFDVLGNFVVCCNENSGTVTVFALDKRGIPGVMTDKIFIPGALCVTEKV